MENPKTPKQKSQKQEKRAAKDYGGRVIKGSGSGGEKGDVNLRAGIKLEAKRTDKESLSIKRSWLLKIEEEAFSANKMPALEIEIQDVHWVMIPEHEFRQYVEWKKGLRDE